MNLRKILPVPLALVPLVAAQGGSAILAVLNREGHFARSTAGSMDSAELELRVQSVW